MYEQHASPPPICMHYGWATHNPACIISALVGGGALLMDAVGLPYRVAALISHHPSPFVNASICM